MVSRQLRQLHRQLYEYALAEAKSQPSLTNPYILEYAEKLTEDLPDRFTQVSATALITAVSKARLILYGDFHTFRQSQRGLLRLIRGLLHRQRSSTMTLGLELLETRDQPYVDAWLLSEIDDAELLKAIQYQKKWGFSWRNYRMFFEFCREAGIKIIGFNASTREEKSLKNRDHYAAKVIAHYLVENPQQRLFCLIGEYHLAWQHLPAALIKNLSLLKGEAMLRIFNNLDKFYFELEPDFAGSHTQYLQLDYFQPTYCIMNSPPWVKWLSVSMWEEQQIQDGEQLAEETIEASDLEEDDPEAYTELSFDFDFHILNFMKQISGFLRLELDEAILDHFHVYYRILEEDYPQLQERLSMTDRSFLSLIHRYSVDGVGVLCRKRTIFLYRLSLNNLAEASGQLLLSLQSSFTDEGGCSFESFYRRILKYAAGTFATKVINPRLKVYHFGYYRSYLRKHYRRKLYGFAAQKRTIYRALLQHDEWVVSSEGRFSEKTVRRSAQRYCELDELTHYELSRLIGEILGYRLYRITVLNKINSVSLQSLYSCNLQSAQDVFTHFETLYKSMR